MLQAPADGDPGQPDPPGGEPGFLIRADPDLVEELEYCVPRGIPHSEFLGRVVGPDQPRWEDRDRELALAYMAMDRERCSGCGTFQDEWGRDRFAYVAHTSICPGCENLENEKLNIPGDGKPGLKIYLLPRQVSESMEDDDDLEG